MLRSSIIRRRTGYSESANLAESDELCVTSGSNKLSSKKSNYNNKNNTNTFAMSRHLALSQSHRICLGPLVSLPSFSHNFIVQKEVCTCPFPLLHTYVPREDVDSWHWGSKNAVFGIIATSGVCNNILESHFPFY